MPAQTKAAESAEVKTQPWKAFWPVSESGLNTQFQRKALLPSGGGNGAYGYDDKDKDDIHSKK